MFCIIAGILLFMANELQAKEECGETMKVVSRANNELSFKLFKMMSKEDNDVMSPLSILSAFSILMNGAKGETLEDLIQFLEYKNSLQKCDQDNINKGFELVSTKYQSVKPKKEKTPGLYGDFLSGEDTAPQLSMANRVILNDQLNLVPQFENTVKQHFRGDIQRADFENNAVEETNKLNEWIRNQTNNKIEKILDKLGKDTSAVIVNALYFKGLWDEDFFDGVTEKSDFYNNGVTATKTDMMYQEHAFRYGESSELDSQLLEMDYMSGDISFVVVLPKERNGLSALKNKINATNFEQAINAMTRQNTKVFLPKFKAEKSYDLMEDINPKPIALTERADLTGITSDKLKVDKIQHKVFIEVNEKGTEAAAVTAILLTNKSAKFYEETMTFKADHPFLYFIRDKSNSMILFYGQINAF